MNIFTMNAQTLLSTLPNSTANRIKTGMKEFDVDLLRHCVDVYRQLPSSTAVAEWNVARKQFIGTLVEHGVERSTAVKFMTNLVSLED